MIILYAFEMALWLFSLVVMIFYLLFTERDRKEKVGKNHRVKFVVVGVLTFYFFTSYFLGSWLGTDIMLPLGLGEFFAS